MPEIILNDVPKQPCQQDSLKPGIFWADEEETKLLTPTNIVGYYLRMIQAYLNDSGKYSNVSVKPAINKELNEDFGNPIVVVKRDVLAPMNIGVRGDKKPLTSAMQQAIPTFEEEYPEASLEDSKVYSDLINMGIHINVYGASSAEVEAIGNIIHPLIMATSYDALKHPFPFIQYVNPPVMSPVDVVEKHDDVYMLNLSWEVTYRDDTVLLIKKNVLKYATIIVRDEPIENIIYRFNESNQ
jgi:hypothetical protein